MSVHSGDGEKIIGVLVRLVTGVVIIRGSEVEFQESTDSVGGAG